MLLASFDQVFDVHALLGVFFWDGLYDSLVNHVYDWIESLEAKVLAGFWKVRNLHFFALIEWAG